MGGLPTCKGEQLTFWPYWRQKFGEFEISSFAEHSVAPEPSFGNRDFTVEGWVLVNNNPLSAEDERFLEQGYLEVQNNDPWYEIAVFRDLWRNIDDPT